MARKGLQWLMLVLLATLLPLYLNCLISLTFLPSPTKCIESEDSLPKGGSVPKIQFYLYPLENFPSFWGANSTCDHSKLLTPKYDVYIHAIQAMKRHPWRTSNPHEALLAILPISVDVHARGGCPGLNEDTILKELKQVLENSPIFPTIRHVFIAQDFKSNEFAQKILSLLNPAGIRAYHDKRSDCKTNLPYSTNYASYMSMRDPNSFRMPNPAPFGSSRIYSVNMVGQFDERVAYKERVALFTSKGQHIPHFFIITTYDKEMKYDEMILKGFQLRSCQSHNDTDRCISPDSFPSRMDTQEAMEKSNYTLALRGDYLGSDRWMQAMVAGTALIQVLESEKTWEWFPFPCAIPWKDFVLSIPREKYMQDPIKSLTELMANVPEKKLLELQHLSMHYAADIDWTAHNSRVLENFLLDSYYIQCRAFEQHKCISNSVTIIEKGLCKAQFGLKRGPTSTTLDCYQVL